MLREICGWLVAAVFIGSNVNVAPAEAQTTPRVFRDCDDCPDMVVVPAGSFTMGSPPGEEEHWYDEEQREVKIGYPFAVAKYEATWAEWERCVSEGGCNGAGPLESGGDNGWGKGLRPVMNVDWYDAQTFVTWLSRKTGKPYRLLSEAEWEYAARAGTTTPFSFGAMIAPSQANYKGTETYGRGSKGEDRQKTIPVGSFPSNAFGLYDMHGNVQEWVEDCVGADTDIRPADGKAFAISDCANRVIRGGSWSNYPNVLRSADRLSYPARSRWSTTGFRIARALP